ncbi:MAG: M14/M99 family metallopeptidase [Pseudomonadota bacterium]
MNKHMLRNPFAHRKLSSRYSRKAVLKPYSKQKRAILTLLIALLPCCIPVASWAYNQHQVFFQNTEHELNVYRIYGEEPGKTLLIIGGMHGNEPGGYLAADLYVEMALKKGNLIVVPRANFISILMNGRELNGDMNRKFENVDSQDKDIAIIEKLKELIKESDFLLNLHDGTGYYSDMRVSDLRNPMKYGQSIIVDCETLPSQKYNTIFDLASMAQKVCERVNGEIKNSEHHFHFNNHRTASPDTMHKDQRKSATYFAVKQIEIPAFGIETSQNIPSPRDRVRYQTMVINLFMEEFGIIPENPGSALPDPIMKYLFVSVNEKRPIVVYNNETLFIEKGDSLSVIHVEGNYERGLTADICGLGSYNDLRQKLVITKETDIIVKKDNLNCGKVSIAFKEPSETMTAERSIGQENKKTDIIYLILQVNAAKVALSPGEHKKVHKADNLVIKELITHPSEDAALKVNFRGFVGNPSVNDGEDRGYTINIGKDLIAKYSEKSAGKIYTIEVTKEGRPLAEFAVDIAD